MMKQLQKYATFTFISGMVVKKSAYPGETVNSEIPRIISLMKPINATENMANTNQNQRSSQYEFSTKTQMIYLGSKKRNKCSSPIG